MLRHTHSQTKVTYKLGGEPIPIRQATCRRDRLGGGGEPLAGFYCSSFSLDVALPLMVGMPSNGGARRLQKVFGLKTNWRGRDLNERGVKCRIAVCCQVPAKRYEGAAL